MNGYPSGVTPTPQNPRDGRIEPVVDWSRPAPARRPGTAPAPATPAWRERRRWRWLALLAVVFAVGLVAFRGQIAEALWPDTQVQRLLAQGELALAQGRLSARDGSGARERFEAALALDSDRGEAREGLRQVGNAALVRASAALRENRLDDARAALELARGLQVPSAATDAMAEALRLRSRQTEGVALMLQRARLAHEAGRLEGDDAALPLYQEVLRMDPQMTTALEGREDALSDLLQQAHAALEDGRPADAAGIVASAERFDPGHAELPAVRAELARALEVRRERAAALLRRGRLDAAADAYRQVLDAAPADADALQGLERVAAQYAARSQRLAADFEFDKAVALLAQARAIAPGSDEVAAAQRALERAQRARSQLDAPLPARQREARLKVLLEAMRRAEARGDWLTPPGESAFDKLRAAQALAPDHASVQRATARLVPATRSCFEDELRGNRIGRARSCYDAWVALDPGSSQLADARRRLAQKWVAVGTERLGAGDVAFAARALQEARALDAGAPGVDEFAARVQSAQGAAIR